jgi:hypothetical protein
VTTYRIPVEKQHHQKVRSSFLGFVSYEQPDEDASSFSAWQQQDSGQRFENDEREH